MTLSSASEWQHLNPKNILIRMPNWLGDAIMATPVLTDVRNQWPEAKITALCQGALSQVLLHDPHVDHIISFKRPKGGIFGKQQNELLTALKNEPYDLSLLLTNSFSSAWWFWKAGVKNRVGYSTHWRRFLLDLSVPLPKTLQEQHLVKTYKMLLEPLGIPVSSTAPALFLTDSEQITIREKLLEYGITNRNFIIGINPGAAYGSAKCWLPERFKEITERLLKYPNAVILYFGDKAGAPLVQEICRHMPDRVINLAGQTSLRELMGFIKACDVFLTNDSGPMHMASALGTPLLALFGSTSDRTTSPYQGGKVIHKHVPCSPCYRRECPIDFRCMKQISVEEVYQELQSFIPANT